MMLAMTIFGLVLQKWIFYLRYLVEYSILYDQILMLDKRFELALTVTI